MENKHELNERQKTVYAYLEVLNGECIKLKDLCEELKYEYNEFEIDNANFHNSSARRILTRDIRAINDSDEINKFVISNNQGVALASEETYVEELEREKIKVLRMLKLYWKKVKKVSLNHQMTLEIDLNESKEIEALVRKVGE